MFQKAPLFLMRIMVMLIPAVTPFALYYAFERPTVSQGFFLQIAVITFLQFILIVWLFSGGAIRLRLTLVDCSIAAYAFLIILSSALKGSEPLFNLKESIFPVSMILYYFVARNLRLSERGTTGILIPILIAGAVCAIYGIMQYFGIEYLGYMAEQKRGKLNVVSFLGHPNFLAAFIGPMLYIAVAIFIGSRSLVLRGLCIASALTISVCLVLAGARGAWLGLIISALFLYIAILFLPFFKTYRRYFTIAFLALALLMGAIFALMAIPNSLIPQKYNMMRRLMARSEISSRLYGWCIARDMFLRNPVLGIGYGGYTARYWDYQIEFQKKPENEVYSSLTVRMKGIPPGQVHNEILEIASETGILGLTAFLLILVGTFRGALTEIYRNVHPMQRSITVLCLLAGLVFLLTDSMFNFTFQLPASGILFWLLLALANNESEQIPKPTLKLE